MGREFGSGGQKRFACRLGRLQQGGLERGGDQGFQVAPANFGVGVFGANHLALLREADLPAHRARRLGQDGLVAGAAAAPYGAAAPMEHAQPDRMAAAEFVKHLDQRDLGAVQLPVAGEDAAVFVAVRVAQHDVLLAATALHQRGHAGQCIEVAHDGPGVAQVFNGFKQRHHDQVAHRVGVQSAAQQTHFFL